MSQHEAKVPQQQEYLYRINTRMHRATRDLIAANSVFHKMPASLANNGVPFRCAHVSGRKITRSVFLAASRAFFAGILVTVPAREWFATPYEVLEKMRLLKVWQQPMKKNASINVLEIPYSNVLSYGEDSHPSPSCFFFGVAVLEWGSQNCSFIGTIDRLAPSSLDAFAAGNPFLGQNYLKLV